MAVYTQADADATIGEWTALKARLHAVSEGADEKIAIALGDLVHNAIPDSGAPDHVKDIVASIARAAAVAKGMPSSHPAFRDIIAAIYEGSLFLSKILGL